MCLYGGGGGGGGVWGGCVGGGVGGGGGGGVGVGGVGGGGGVGGVPSHNSPVLEPTISKFGPIMHLNPNLIYVGLSNRVNASHLSKFDLIENPNLPHQMSLYRVP